MFDFCKRFFGAYALMLFFPWFTTSAHALTSDDFNAFTLDTSVWSVIDPQGDSVISVDGYRLKIDVPADTSHDVWLSGNMAPRVMQVVTDSDFEMAAKFESPIGEQFQLQGILVEQDAGHFLRFDFYSDGTNTKIFAAAFSDGSVSVKVNKTVTVGNPMFLRITRTGNQWTQWYSEDGVTWTQAISFRHNLAVETAGVFAGNKGNPAPRHIALIDYFFNTAAPISPEDINVSVDNIAPVTSNITTTIQSGEVLISWVTDELAVSQVSYGETLSYELGTVSSGTSSGTQHEVLVSGLTPDTRYNFQISAQDTSENTGLSANIEVQTSVSGTNTPPQIDIWYGAVQEFGFIGIPQRWMNVLGNVSDPDGVASLSYALNNGAAMPLTIGANNNRLADDGDFNAEIDRSHLRLGANRLVITAVDNLGYTAEQTVIVNYADGNVWPMTYSIDWANTTSIQSVAHIVDGHWKLTPTGVRPVKVGYDRLLAIGDVSWKDYEITVPLTVYSIDPAGYASPSNGPGVGVLMRWIGHNDINVKRTQPKIGWRPIGALAWYRWRSTTNERLEFMGSMGGIQQTNFSKKLQFGLSYMMKLRVKTNNGQSVYRLKLWKVGQPEPASWDLTGGSGGSVTQQVGSLMLVAHHVDVEFGNVSIVPVGVVDTLKGAVIENLVEQVNTVGAIINWTTDEPTTATIRYGVDTNYGSTLSHSAYSTSHRMTIDGMLASQAVHYEISVVDVDGNVTTSGNKSFITQTNSPPILGEPVGEGDLSDAFDEGSLAAEQWAFVDPVGDSVVSVTNGQLAISVGAGIEHNVWKSGNNSARVTHALPNQDFSAEVKFDSIPRQRYQLQGILVEQDEHNFVRFDFYSDGRDLKIFAAIFIAGQPTVMVNTIIETGGPLYMRIERLGSQWIKQYSYDGSNWQTAVTFMHTLNIASASLFAGNAGLNAPAYTALIDHYELKKIHP